MHFPCRHGVTAPGFDLFAGGDLIARLAYRLQLKQWCLDVALGGHGDTLVRAGAASFGLVHSLREQDQNLFSEAWSVMHGHVVTFRARDEKQFNVDTANAADLPQLQERHH